MKKTSIISRIAAVSMIGSAMPLIAFAANRDLSDLMATATAYLSDALQVLMALAVLYFVWNVINYFMKPGDSEAHAEAGTYILYSLIGFFAILSLWGLVNIVSNTFNLDNTQSSNLKSQINNLIPTN